MKKKRTSYTSADSGPAVAADAILARIKDIIDRNRALQTSYDDELDRVALLYEQQSVRLKAELASTEAELKRFVLANRDEIFANKDRRDLINGSLLYHLEQRVRRSRNITPTSLEELGEAGAVKIVKSINWDELEKWDDARLARAGTERAKKESVQYELKGGIQQ